MVWKIGKVGEEDLSFGESTFTRTDRATGAATTTITQINDTVIPVTATNNIDDVIQQIAKNNYHIYTINMPWGFNDAQSDGTAKGIPLGFYPFGAMNAAAGTVVAYLSYYNTGWTHWETDSDDVLDIVLTDHSTTPDTAVTGFQRFTLEEPTTKTTYLQDRWPAGRAWDSSLKYMYLKQFLNTDRIGPMPPFTVSLILEVTGGI